MSGNIASRYIGGVPYGPGRSVGRYPNVASVGSTPGVTANIPVLQQRPADTSGTLTPALGAPVAAPLSGGAGSSAGNTAAALGGAGGGGGGGGGNMLASLLLGGLGLLPYLPDAYDAVSNLFGGGATPQELPTPPEQLTPEQAYDAGGENYASDATVGPWGMPVVPFGGGDFGYVPPGASAWSPAGGQGVIWDPNGSAGQLGTTNGWVYPDGGGGAVDAASGLGAAGAATNWAGIPLEATQVSDMGLGSIGGADVATSLAYAPAAIFARGTSSFAKPGGEMGAQIGSALGGVVGGAFLGPWGAAAGTIAGGAIGGQIGPNPTIGGNFSSIGTFDGSGGLNWGNAGGDNGANANDASSFANWFAPALQQQAAAQGYGFNPNMGGAQIRVGGYDNPSRSGQAPAGGYFYDITNAGGGFGGDPDRYALRSSDQFANNAYSPAQANAFTQNVLADLIARGVYTQGGQPGQDQAYLGSTLGANYGWYGAPGDLYSQTEYGGSGGFGDILQGRQNAITGYVNQNQLQQQTNAAAQQVLGAGYNPAGGYDPGYGWQAMAAAMPEGGAPSVPPDIYQGAAGGMQGVQMGENGPIWAPVGGFGGQSFVSMPQADGGA